MPTDRRMYLPSTDVDKMESAVKGLDIRLVRGSDSRLLSKAYRFLARFFPVTEYDPLRVWKKALIDTEKDFVFRGLGHPVYLKNLSFAVIDRKGRFGKRGAVVAYADGTFEANKRTNALYLSHVVVCPKARRLGIGTALENAVLVKCHDYAMRAETCLRTKYRVVRKTGLKIHFLITDIEFANLSTKRFVKESVGRLIFHGRNGVSVCSPSDVSYVQSDTTYGSACYNPDKWVSVPMFFGLRAVGREKTKVFSGSEIKSLLDLLYSGFMMFMNPLGVAADRFHSIGSIGKKVRVYALPACAIGAVRFVKEHGEIYEILNSFYRDHVFTLKHKKIIKPKYKPRDIPFILCMK